MSYKAILFDLDGTLTDSGEGIMNAITLALEHFGLDIPSREQMRRFVGPPLWDSFATSGMRAEDIDEGIRVFRAYYAVKGIFENTPYAGIKELLSDLKAMGYRIYVATSKPEFSALQVLEHFELGQYFDLICGASTDESRSSKADVIAYLSEKVGGLSQAVMVGDTVYDVLGAATHGIPTIGVAWGYGNADDMKQAGAIAIANTPAELLQLLQQ